MNRNRTAERSAQSLFPVGPSQQRVAATKRTNSRRKITPEAGRGLEKLAHALEYLADEFAHDGCEVVRDYDRIQVIQLLASLNRQLYFSCEVEPTFRERVRSLLRRFSTTST